MGLGTYLIFQNLGASFTDNPLKNGREITCKEARQILTAAGSTSALYFDVVAEMGSASRIAIEKVCKCWELVAEN